MRRLAAASRSEMRLSNRPFRPTWTRNGRLRLRSLRAVAECGIPLLGPFDWDHPEFQVGTRRFESCRARHYNHFGQRQRQSVRVGRRARTERLFFLR
jgi:hypothetical protein